MKTHECNEVERLIVAELDEGLNPSQQELLDNHLRECSACRQAKEETVTLLSSIASDLPEEPGEEFWRFYRQSLDARLREQELRPAWGLWWKSAGVLVAAVIALVVIRVAFFQPDNRQIADLRVMSPDLIQELAQVYGPTSEELPRGSVNADQLMAVVDARASRFDDSDEQWFEVEDELGPLYL